MVSVLLSVWSLRSLQYLTCGDGVDADLHGGAGAIQVVVEGEVQTSRGGGY